jgi:hypothetical protein
MMKTSISRVCFTLLIVGLVLCLCPGNAEGNRDLPGDAVVYVKTSALTDAFGGIESFAVGAVRNTPMAMMVMPGMLRMQVVQMSGMAPDFFDFAQPAEVLVWQSQPPAAEGIESPVAFVFPVMDYGANLKRFEARGMVLKTDGDGVTVVSPKPDAGGKTFFMSNLGEGRTLVAFSRDGIQRYNSIVTQLPGIDEALPKNTTFQARIDLDKLVRLNRERIRVGLDQFANIANSMGASPNGMNMAFIMGIVRNGMGLLVDMLESVDMLEVRMLATAEGLTFDSTMYPVPGTRLDEFCRLAATGPMSETGLTGHLPASSTMVVEASLPQSAESLMVNAMMDAMETLFDGMGSDDDRVVKLMDFMQSMTEGMLPLLDGKMAFGGVFGFEDGRMTQSQTTLLGTTDADAYRALMAQSVQDSGGMVNLFYELMGLPIRLEMNYVEDAGAVAGVATSELGFNATWDEAATTGAWSELPVGQRQQMLENMRQMSQLYATSGDNFVSTAGADRVKGMETVLTSLQAGSAERNPMLAGLDRFDGDRDYHVISSGAVRYGDLFFIGMAQGITAGKGEASVEMAAVADKLLAMLPSKHPVVYELGVGNGTAGVASMRQRMFVPSGMVSEMIQGFGELQSAFMQAVNSSVSE